MRPLNLGKSRIERLLSRSTVKRGDHPVEQYLKSDVKHWSRREPLGFVYFGLLLFMVVYFIRPEDWIPWLALVPVAKITGILILLAVVFSLGKVRWQFPLEIISLSLLTVQLWLAVPFSPVWRGGAFKVMLDFSKLLPLVLVIYWAVRSMKRLQWILFVQTVSVAVISIVSILVARTTGGRLRGVISGVYGNSNDLALFIDLSLPLCLAFALTTRSIWKKVAWTIVMLGMIYAIVLTASRAGTIALVVAALVCLWQLGVKERRFYLFLLVPVAVLGIVMSSGNSLERRFEQTNTDSSRRVTEASESAQQREQLLIESLKVTAQHPLLGVGPGNFVIISGFWHVTHNSYTQISAEGGIPALLLYVFIFWRAAANLRNIKQYANTRKGVRLFSMALQASLAAYLVGSFFASLAYLLFPYFLVSYTSALRLVVHREQAIPRPTPQPVPKSVPIEVTVWQ